MRAERKLELLKKGWMDEEIKRAESLLEKEHQHDKFFSKIVFWSALVVIIFANLLVSLILIPFLVALERWFLYLTVFLLAGVIGFLYNFLITDIGHLEKKHHVWAGILIPGIALLNMLMMVLISNKLIEILKLNNKPHNPFLLALVFVVAFILPYLVNRIKK